MPKGQNLTQTYLEVTPVDLFLSKRVDQFPCEDFNSTVYCRAVGNTQLPNPYYFLVKVLVFSILRNPF